MQQDSLRVLTYEAYHEHPAVRKGDLDLIHRSPAHYRQAKDFPEPSTPAQLWGQMFHALILQPDVFAATYAVMPDGIDKRQTDGKAQWAAWEEEHAGLIPVAKPTMVELNAMRDSLLFHPLASSALEGALTERSVFWKDTTENGEVECKARPDIITTEGFIVDLKTCTDARPDEFARSCWRYRYHVQSAFYQDGCTVALGSAPQGFIFFAIEKEPPYAVAAYLANEAMVDQGRREYQADLETYAACRALDKWPAYPADVTSLMLPVWAQDEETRNGN